MLIEDATYIQTEQITQLLVSQMAEYLIDCNCELRDKDFVISVLLQNGFGSQSVAFLCDRVIARIDEGRTSQSTTKNVKLLNCTSELVTAAGEFSHACCEVVE